MQDETRFADVPPSGSGTKGQVREACQPPGSGRASPNYAIRPTAKVQLLGAEPRKLVGGRNALRPAQSVVGIVLETTGCLPRVVRLRAG